MDELDAQLELYLERAGNNEQKKEELRALHATIRQTDQVLKEWKELEKTLSPEELKELEEAIIEDWIAEIGIERLQEMGILKPLTKQ
jgi:hypothetical protein